MQLRKIFSFCLLVLATAFVLPSSAQTVNCNIVVTPPYSTRISDYGNNPGKVIITLTLSPNSRPTDVFLRASIVGDNGVKAATKMNYVPSSFITLQPGVPNMVDAQTLAGLYDANSFTLTGTSKEDIMRRNGLPEGNYEFCVQVFERNNSTTPISQPAPSGCTRIRLTKLEPPYLLKPANNESIIKSPVQNLIFSWSVPAGSEPGTQYLFRMVEMLDPTKNPNDAFNAKTQPAFYEATVMNNIMLYGPVHPQLVEGRRYAWAVTALPGPQGNAYNNGGRSEVRSFVYAKPATPPAPLVNLVYPADKAVIKPMGDVMLKWDYNSSIKSNIETPVVVEIKPGQSPEQAIKLNSNEVSSKEPYKSINMDVSKRAGKSFAWKVDVLDLNNKTHSSKIQTFTVGKAMVTLVYPADKEEITVNPSGGSTDVLWDYDKSIIAGSESPVVVEMKTGQTPAQAIKQNTNIAGGKEPSKSAFVNFSAYTGKTLAWQVTIYDKQGKPHYSDIQTFVVMSDKDKALKEAMKNFVLCGFPIKVTSLKLHSGFTFSGNGITQLYKGGPEFNFSFQNLVVQPFGAKITNGNVTEFTDWRAVNVAPGGKAEKSFYNAMHLGLSSNEVDGSLDYELKKIEFKPIILTHYDASKKFFVQDAIPGANAAFYNGKLKWTSDYYAKDNNGSWEPVTFSMEQSVVFDYDKKFKSLGGTLNAEGTNGTNTFEPMGLTKTKLKLLPYVTFNADGKADFTFSGYIDITSPNPERKGLKVDFANKPELIFDQTIAGGWYSVLNKDGSCTAAFDKVKVNLRTTNQPLIVQLPNGQTSVIQGSNFPFGVSIPELTVNIVSKQKSYPFTYKQVAFNGGNGLYFDSKESSKKDIEVMGFNVSTKKSEVVIKLTRLLQMKIEGDVTIPLINQKASLQFYVNNDGVQEAELVFKSGQTSTIYDNASTGDKCTFKATYGTITKGEANLSGYVSFSNKQNSEKNLNVKDVLIDNLVITSAGKVGNAYATDLTLTHPQGNFNGYKFTPNNLKFMSDGYGPKIQVSGMLVMADNLTPGAGKKNNFTTTVSFDESAVTGGGSALRKSDFKTFKEYLDYKQQYYNKTVSFNSKASAGTDNESSTLKDASLTYYDNDALYGTGFKASVGFGLKSPVDASSSSPQSINAIMWIGRKQGFNYWFLEAGQKNVVVVPTGILDLAINGFKGRVFYHMRPEGENINNAKYIPDDSKFMGVYGQVNLITATDNGVKFWGDLAMQVLTNNSGLESITLFGNGDFISDGEGKAGIIQARNCLIKLEWSPVKRVLGDFTVDLNAYDMIGVHANAGFEFSPNHFRIHGKGSGKLMGKDAGAECGFDFTDEHINVYGDFKLVDINWHNGGLICDDDIYIKAGVKFNAGINFKQFQFSGDGTLYGKASFHECGEYIVGINLSLNAQVDFPSPTCVSAGVSIAGFDLDAGVKNGAIIFSKCH